MVQKNKSYLLTGAGARGLGMFARPLLHELTDSARLAGLVDINPARLREVQLLLGTQLPAFTDFNQALKQVDPDGIIVATRDDTHARYVIAGLGAGKRIYCEKPLCTTIEQCRAIREAAGASNAKCFVTHNARYNPGRGKLKELVDAGRIGAIQHIEFRENLDLAHGADYFRRWHKFKRNSGGLMIHKASHHFDFLNWLIGANPDRIRAQGGTFFYGRNGPFHGRRCDGCKHAWQCAFDFRLENDPQLHALYAKAEACDGYLRDACLFDPAIDTEDHVSALVVYANGVRVNYTLTAYAAYEGEHLAVQGTEGRIEYQVMHMCKAAPAQSPDWSGGAERSRRLTIYDFWKGTAESVDLPAPVSGGHGGADTLLRRDFFQLPWDTPRPDRMATLNEAIQAVLVGLAANESIASDGEEVHIQALL